MAHAPRFLDIVNDSKSRVRECTVQEVLGRLAKGESLHLVDVREDEEFAKGRAKGATHLGKGVIERDVEKTFPDTATELILYCGGGYRSALAADALQKMGYSNVVSMDGGWKGWQAAGGPTEN